MTTITLFITRPDLVKVYELIETVNSAYTCQARLKHKERKKKLVEAFSLCQELTVRLPVLVGS